MYTQVSEHLPGIKLDFNAKVIRFNINDFYEELPAYIENWEDPDYFHLSPGYTRVYRRFLDKELAHYATHPICMGEFRRAGKKLQNNPPLYGSTPFTIATAGCRTILSL